MTRRIAIAMAALAASMVLILGVPLVAVSKDAGTRSLRMGLERDALVLAAELSALNSAVWDARVRDYEAATGARVALVDTERNTVFDSEDPNPMGQLSAPEIITALSGEIVHGTRPSREGDPGLHYAAVPITHGRETLGALRLSVTDRAVDATVTRIEWMLVGTLGLVLVITTATAWLVARVISRPLRQLADVARRIGADPHTTVDPIEGPREVREVADALSETGAELAVAIDKSRAVAEEASHHLRTPLAALRLRIEALSDASEGRTHADAEAALVEVDRLARRIDQILAMAAAPSLSGEVIDVSEAVTRRLGHWRSFAAETGITVSDATGPAFIRHQLGTVERTLDELIGNALNYAESEVRVRLRTEGDVVVLIVSDDGPGIPTQEREAVFGRFHRGSTANPGGSGLGLALVRESARSVGGDATIADVDRGTTAEVRWPSAVGLDAEEPSPASLVIP